MLCRQIGLSGTKQRVVVHAAEGTQLRCRCYASTRAQLIAMSHAATVTATSGVGEAAAHHWMCLVLQRDCNGPIDVQPSLSLRNHAC